MVNHDSVAGNEVPFDPAFERALLELQESTPSEAEVRQAVRRFHAAMPFAKDQRRLIGTSMPSRWMAIAASFTLIMMGMVASTQAWADVVKDYSRPLNEPQVISTLQPGAETSPVGDPTTESEEVGWPFKMVLLVHVVSLLVGLSGMLLSWVFTLAGWCWVHLRSETTALTSTTLSVRLGKMASIFLAGGLVFYLVGILFGCVWSHSSWGRIWSWDPREAFSLLTVTWGGVWLRAIHRENWTGREIRVAWTQSATVATVAFGMTLNMVILGGMYAEKIHSYGPAVVLPNAITGVIVLIVAFLWMIHGVRVWSKNNSDTPVVNA